MARLARAEGEWVPKRAAAEQARLQAIAAAQGAIAAYTPEYNAAKAKAEAEQKQRIAAAEKAMKDAAIALDKGSVAKAGALPVSQLHTRWQGVRPATVAASGGIKLARAGGRFSARLGRAESCDRLHREYSREGNQHQRPHA